MKKDKKNKIIGTIVIILFIVGLAYAFYGMTRDSIRSNCLIENFAEPYCEENNCIVDMDKRASVTGFWIINKNGNERDNTIHIFKYYLQEEIDYCKDQIRII